MTMLLRRALLAISFLIAPNLLLAAEITQFQPSGPSLIQGSHLNELVNAINAMGGSAAYFGCTATGSTTSPVNCVTITGGATTVAPKITVGGPSADTNIGVALYGNGTGRTFLGNSTGVLAGLQVAKVASAVNDFVVTPGATGTPPSLVVGGSSVDTNIGMYVAGAGTGAVYLGGTTSTLAGLQIAQPASRVNDIVLTPGATGTRPSLVTGGALADTNIGITVAGAGTGSVLLGGTTTTLAGLQVAQTASRVNGVVVTPGATGTAATITAGTAGADANVNLNVTGNGTGRATLGSSTTCSGTTTATCNAQRFTVSVTGLTTAASTAAAAMTVTNSSVLTSAIHVLCQVNGYAGTGNPIATLITPGTTQVAFTILNVSTGAALNATVPVECVVVD